MNFTDKVVLITGAGSGIGKQIAIHFAQLSANLMLISVKEDRLNAVAEVCKKLSKGRVFIYPVDLRRAENIKDVVAVATKEFGKIDVLVNSAGIVSMDFITSPNLLDNLDDVLDVNLKSAIVLIHYAADALVESKGCVINIGSIMGTTAGKGSIAYNVSKAALVQLTKCVALELADRGVRVNCLSPGSVRTNIISHLLPTPEDTDKFWDSLIMDHPLKQLTTTDDVANMAVYLASDKAKSITGCDFIVDSGKTLTKFKHEY